MQQFTQWNAASKSLSESIICALEGIAKYNYQMIVKYLPNNEHTSPLTQYSKNLDDPFNWKCTSQFHREPEEMKQALERAVNDTERDLLQNWTWIFGEPEAIEIYKNTGKCTAGLFKGMGTCSQVRIKDMVKYLRDNGENERADLWESPNQFFNSGLWTPKNRGDYREPVDCMSYAVYYNNNSEGLTKDQLNELLDNSVKNIINS